MLIKSARIHKPSQLNKYCFHGKVPLPLDQAWQLGGIDLDMTHQPHSVGMPTPPCAHPAGSCVDAWEVDLRDECNIGRDVGVLVAAVDFQAIDSVLVFALEAGQ